MKNSFKALLAMGLVSVGVVGCSTVSSSSACSEKKSCKAACESPAPACAKKCQGVVGRWAFELFGSDWMGIEKKADGSFSASILWGGGSPVSQGKVSVTDKTSAVLEQELKGSKNPVDRRIRVTSVKVTGDIAALTVMTKDGNGKVLDTKTCTAKRIPDVPPAPKLCDIVYGNPVNLFAGGIDAWKSMNPKNHFGWSMKDGVLSNRIARGPDGKAKGHSANIVTKRADFFDFNLKYDVRVLPACNSGVYLRGIYEIQVLDSYGKPLDCHNMAAFYGRITPTVAAEKPANEWQSVDVTLYKRHVTVILNGKKIIDNQPVLGCTGGAITSDEFVPGPIYLQGDHSDADFRNMVLTPIIK